MKTHQSTEECFIDLCDRFLSFDDRNLFAEIFGIKPVTLANWNNRGFKAMGEKLVRIRVGLELTGYTVSEWIAFDRNLYNLVEAITYNFLTLEEVTKKLSYANSSQLLQVLLTNTTMNKERYDKALRLVEKIGPEVGEKRLAAIDSLSSIELAEGQITTVLVDCDPIIEYWSEIPIYPEISVQEKILMFDNLVKALLPLARFFDGSPSEDRKVLRKAVGYAEMSEFTELLRGLSSEKYRESR